MNKDIHSHYKNLLIEHGDSHLSAQYSSKETQDLRFFQLLRAGDIEGKKILDFGCGTAAFAGFIKDSGINCDYVGYDFVEEFYPIAQKKYPNARFINREELEKESFDVIFISGVFNNKTKNNQLFFEETIAKLFKSTSSFLAFNMMSAHVDYKDKGLFYIFPEDVFSYCKNNITPFITLVNDYQLKNNVIPFEFSCFLYKK